MPKGDKPRKKKEPKDPNAPKKPSGAYIHFCNTIRETIKKENPEFQATEIVKAMGAKWKGMNDDEKKKFFEMAEADKERYAKENAAYTKSE